MDDHRHEKQQREWRGARGPYRDDRYNGVGITRPVILRLVQNLMQSLGVVFTRTLTYALDALGTATHGAMLYRGASVWQILAPNASPLPLITQGVGAAPVWTPLPLASLGNDAAVHGSVLFHNGTQWTELAPGTNGRVLTTHDVGFDPTWDAPGAGSFTLTEEEVDFGSTPVWNGEFVVTAAGVVASDLILVSPSGNAPTGLTADEMAWDVIQYAAYAGTGNFTLRASVAPGPVSGKRKVYWTKVS